MGRGARLCCSSTSNFLELGLGAALTGDANGCSVYLGFPEAACLSRVFSLQFDGWFVRRHAEGYVNGRKDVALPLSQVVNDNMQTILCEPTLQYQHHVYIQTPEVFS